MLGPSLGIPAILLSDLKGMLRVCWWWKSKLYIELVTYLLEVVTHDGVELSSVTADVKPTVLLSLTPHPWSGK